MRRFLLILLIALGLFAVLGMGWFLPQRLIGTGIDGYAGPEKEYAKLAVWDAKSLISEGLNPAALLVTAYRVTSVVRCPQHPIECGPPIRKNDVYYENPSCEGEPFAVEVQTYTIFGLPLDEVGVRCDESRY